MSPPPPPDGPTDRPADYGSVAVPPQPTKPTKPSTRALAPDLLRGFLMLTMAMDHMALALNTWEHGTGRETEMDGVVIKQWNRPAAYVVRTLTHLCASGFTMLLGMGVVYLGRSRTRLGWSSMRIAKYFAVRGAVLTLVGVLLGIIVSGGKLWFLNFVLFSLAVDYFLAGMLWVVMDKTEPLLAGLVSRVFPDKTDEVDVEEEPLIRRERESSDFGVVVSWHSHNFLLAVLALVTIWWNIWLSPTHGYCQVDDQASTTSQLLSIQEKEGFENPAMSHSPFWGVWFWITTTTHVESVFPPMAWLSFAILGLLYGRVDVTRMWSSRVASLCNMVAGLGFLVIFVMTRVFHFGNLSEGCIQTRERLEHPDQNPYLVSPQAFFYMIKYPPDVAFWAFTLAGNFFLLAFFGGIPESVAKRFTLLLDFGRVALFFYIVHLFVIFALGGSVVAWLGHEVGRGGPMDPDKTKGIDNLFAYLGIWALTMLLLWPLMRWYGRFKGGKSAHSIWRFF